MATPKTLTDLLKAQPQEELEALALSLRAEIAKLEDQLRIVEEALAPRRKSAAPQARSGISRDDYLPIIAAFQRPAAPAEVANELHSRGIEITTNAVRTTMGRLAEDGKLVKLNSGYYVIAGAADENGSSARLSADSNQAREPESAFRLPTEG